MNQTKPNYAAKALFLILLAFFIGGYSANAQSKQELKGVPISESGLTAEEYTTIINHKDVVKLFSTEGILTLTLCKVYGNTNDPQMKHIFIQKDNPNKPQWSAIPYTILREEDYDENN
jgi:hypothetical protein